MLKMAACVAGGLTFERTGGTMEEIIEKARELVKLLEDEKKETGDEYEDAALIVMGAIGLLKSSGKTEFRSALKFLRDSIGNYRGEL